MNKDDYALYVSLLSKKVEAIETMLRITEGQRVFIDNDDVEALAFSMELRQNCIGNIDGVDVRMRAIAGFGGVHSEEVSRLSQTASELICEIERLDAVNRPAALEKLGEYREAIRSVSISNKAVKAYMMIDEENSILFDEKK